MARVAAEAKQCYYPIMPDAMGLILKHLRLNDKKPTEVNIIDPCCGKGAALKQLAEGLEVQPDRVYGVELDGARVEEARAALPRAIILGPASFMGTQITSYSFGLAYVNAPFGDELGGGRREEQGFVERATRLLVSQGIIVIVCPLNALAGNRNFCQFVDSHFEDVKVYIFPDELRKYGEIAVFGRKRKIELPADAVYQHGGLHQMEFQYRAYHWEGRLTPLGEVQAKGWVSGAPIHQREDGLHVWEVPHAWRPNTFKKIAFTDEELADAIKTSPLNRLLEDVPEPKPKRPPLPLDKGHVALLLASGMLDGLVETPEGNHVVRGTAKKVEYLAESPPPSVNEESGTVTEKVIYSQRICLTIRAVDDTGTIHTYSDRPEEDKAAEEEEADQDLFSESGRTNKEHREKVIRRVRELRKKTVANGCTYDEERSAYAMVERLMKQHGIHEWEV